MTQEKRCACVTNGQGQRILCPDHRDEPLEVETYTESSDKLDTWMDEIELAAFTAGARGDFQEMGNRIVVWRAFNTVNSRKRLDPFTFLEIAALNELTKLSSL